MKRSQLHQLTGLRGIAAVAVMLYHFRTYDLITGHLEVVLRHGYLCVDLFFVLSGFVMALSYGSMFRNTPLRSSYPGFLVRRVARVFPLYGALSLAEYAMYHLQKSVPRASIPSPALLSENILMVQAWGLGKSIIGPAWSISTEWAVYLVFPLLVAITLHVRARFAVVIGLIGSTFLIALAVMPPALSHVVHYRGPMDIANGQDYGPVLRCVLEFSFGMLAWRISKTPPFQGVASRSWPSSLVAAAIILFLLFPRSDVFIVFLFPVLISLLSNDQPLLARALSSRLPRWLGDRSYAIYLIHTIVPLSKDHMMHRFIAHSFGHPELIWLTLISCIVFISASLAYRFIEKPGREFVRSLFEPSDKTPKLDDGVLSAP